MTQEENITMTKAEYRNAILSAEQRGFDNGKQSATDSKRSTRVLGGLIIAAIVAILYVGTR
ncbi:hypothetical protein [Methyloversatilis sp.]|uniref:hypothetical protein n=1 Tax=Methyloversatilis sp. TaxID=2569862 RepID=UPI0035B0F237